MKKFARVLALSLLLGTLGAGQALAADGMAIYVNDRYLPLDTMPYVSDGTTFVPLRTVSSALGADVSWADGQANISLGGQDIVLRPNDKNAVINGTAVDLTTAPVLQNGRILVPLRFVSERLGADVAYADHIIDITGADDAALPVFGNDAYSSCVYDGKFVYLIRGGYLDSYGYIEQNTTICRIDPATGESVTLLEGGRYYSLNLAGDALYFTDNGKLTRYDLGSGESSVIIEGVWNPCVQGDYIYWLKTPEWWSSYLWRMPLAGGEAEQIVDNVFAYWPAGDSLFYSDADGNNDAGSLFRCDIDGRNVQELGSNFSMNSLKNLFTCENGAFYGVKRAVNYEELHRFDIAAKDWSMLLELPARSFFGDIKVRGDIIYYTTDDLVQYRGDNPLHLANVSGPLYRFDSDGEVQQLTDCKTGDFYVFRDVLVYQNLESGEWCCERLAD